MRSLDRTVRSRGGTRVIPGRTLSLKTNVRSGYAEVMLYQPAVVRGGRKTIRVHKLVARAFLGAPPAGATINHKDFDRTNNAVSNLEYMSHVENVRHALAAGRMRPIVGEDVSRAVLTEAKVRLFRKLAKSQSVAEIARRFGHPYPTVYAAVRGHNWSHLE